MKRYTIQLGLAGTVAGLLVVGAMLALHGPSSLGWQLATRYTARLSFFLFISVYLTGPISVFWRPAVVMAVLRQRRGMGVGFAGAHFVHLFAIIEFFLASGLRPAIVTVAAGGLAYVLIFLMVLTSNDLSVRFLGPRLWRGLHRTAIHYVWFIFTFTIVGRVIAKPPAPDLLVHQIMLGLALAALSVRIAGFVFRRVRTV